jgi:hypothetical protein
VALYFFGEENRVVQVKFPFPVITKVWSEKTGSLKKIEWEDLESEGGTSFEGTFELELASGVNWGVFT